MRRLLTGYALWFNRTHRRQGHLFQNRFKSIQCQEDAYLLALVRYIHLNPIRIKLVKDLDELSRYPYCGHGVLLEKVKNPWQDTESVLGNGDFVGRVLASAQEAMEKRYALQSRGLDLDRVASRVAEVLGLKPEEVWTLGKYQRIVDARSLLCYWVVRELGVTMSFLARRLRISVPAVSLSVTRGRRIAETKRVHLINK